MVVKFGRKAVNVHPVWLVIYLLLMVLLLNLGFWQLGREGEKREFLEQQQQGMNALPLNLVSIEDVKQVARYQSIVVTGTFDEAHSFLLDNQLWEGKAGYQVLTPFRVVGSDLAVLVNRGWIPMLPNRMQLPTFPTLATPLTIQGRMNEFFRAGVMLKDADQPEPGWPSRIQIPVVEKLSERLGYALLPFQMELSENQPEGFARHWTIQTTIPPEKHRAYAVQWFGLALTLTLLFLWILLKKNRE